MKKPAPDRNTVMECLQELKRRDADDVPDEVLEAWEVSQRSKSRSAYKGWIRIAAAAAVIVLLIAAVPHALGAEGVFSRIGRWTKDIFSFGKLPETEFVYQTDHPGLQELYDTVTALGVERNVVPTWIPDGYQLEQLVVQPQYDSTTVFASYFDDEECIVIENIIFTEHISAEYQKNEIDAITYERNGIMHYILHNDKTYTATWTIENVECSISTGTKESLYKIIASIYEGENTYETEN